MKLLSAKLVLCLGLFIVLIGCKNQEKPKDKKQESRVEKKEKQFNEGTLKNDTYQKISELNRLKMLKPFGYFTTATDTLHLMIPVSSDNFSVREKIDVSSKYINALLIRVTNKSRESILNKPIRAVIDQKYNTNELGLDDENIKDCKKLKVFVVNSINPFERGEIQELKDCLNSLGNVECNYNIEACMGTIKKGDKTIPNDKDGEIVVGL